MYLQLLCIYCIFTYIYFLIKTRKFIVKSFFSFQPGQTYFFKGTKYRELGQNREIF